MEKMPLKKVLLVDDDPTFLKGVMFAIKSMGYEPVLASGGHEAQEILQKETVDAIVSDINMPEGNGLQLLNYAIKNLNVPFILMTGLSDLKEAQKAFDLGAHFFLSKPFKRTELQEALEKCFGKANEDESSSFDNMVKLHIEEFLQGRNMNFPVFMDRKGVVLKISNGGEDIRHEDLSAYRRSGIHTLMVSKKDYKDHLELFDFEAPSAALVKSRVKHKIIEILNKRPAFNSLNLDAFQRVMLHLESALDVLMDNEEIAALMDKDNDYLELKVLTSYFSSLLLQQMGTTSSKEFFQLTAASLLQHAELDTSKLALFSDDIVTLIQQDHSKQDNTFSAAYLFATEFVQLSDTEDPSALMNEFSAKFLNHYDSKILDAFAMIFNLALPPEFSESEAV